MIYNKLIALHAHQIVLATHIRELALTPLPLTPSAPDVISKFVTSLGTSNFIFEVSKGIGHDRDEDTVYDIFSLELYPAALPEHSRNLLSTCEVEHEERAYHIFSLDTPEEHSRHGYASFLQKNIFMHYKSLNPEGNTRLELTDLSRAPEGSNYLGLTLYTKPAHEAGFNVRITLNEDRYDFQNNFFKMPTNKTHFKYKIQVPLSWVQTNHETLKDSEHTYIYYFPQGILCKTEPAIWETFSENETY